MFCSHVNVQFDMQKNEHMKINYEMEFAKSRANDSNARHMERNITYRLFLIA